MDWSAEMMAIHRHYQMWGFVDPYPNLRDCARRFVVARWPVSTRLVLSWQGVDDPVSPVELTADLWQHRWCRARLSYGLLAIARRPT